MQHGSRAFRLGDRVMQLRNDYDRQVFNGDMGRVTALDLEEHTLTVDFDGALVGYEFTQLDELVHAYAVSIHKAQGSEFPVVVIPSLRSTDAATAQPALHRCDPRAAKLVVLVAICAPLPSLCGMTKLRNATRGWRNVCGAFFFRREGTQRWQPGMATAKNLAFR